MNFSVFLIYNLTKPSSFLVTRKGNRYNDIHLFLSPFFLSFWDSSRFALLSKGGKSFSFFLSTLFLFYLFLIKSFGIFFFFSVVVKGNKTHTPPHSNRNPSAAGKRTRQSGQKNTWTKNGCRKCKKCFQIFANIKSKADEGNEIFLKIYIFRPLSIDEKLFLPSSEQNQTFHSNRWGPPVWTRLFIRTQPNPNWICNNNNNNIQFPPFSVTQFKNSVWVFLRCVPKKNK